MNAELLVLQVLPAGLPGLRQSAIRDRIARRVAQTPGAVLPERADINAALAKLARKGLVHSAGRQDPEDGFPYRVYWRDASYVPPLDVGVPA